MTCPEGERESADMDKERGVGGRTPERARVPLVVSGNIAVSSSLRACAFLFLAGSFSFSTLGVDANALAAPRLALLSNSCADNSCAGDKWCASDVTSRTPNSACSPDAPSAHASRRSSMLPRSIQHPGASRPSAAQPHVPNALARNSGRTGARTARARGCASSQFFCALCWVRSHAGHGGQATAGASCLHAGADDRAGASPDARTAAAGSKGG